MMPTISFQKKNTLTDDMTTWKYIAEKVSFTTNVLRIVFGIFSNFNFYIICAKIYVFLVELSAWLVSVNIFS